MPYEGRFSKSPLLILNNPHLDFTLLDPTFVWWACVSCMLTSPSNGRPLAKQRDDVNSFPKILLLSYLLQYEIINNNQQGDVAKW